MKRREFLKKTTLATAGTLALPYILPSGRMFAQTGSRSSEHVVLVMFAGGVRHQESIGMRYLDDSQVGQPYPGNIMYNMLTGEAPTMKIAYGTGEGGMQPIPQLDYFSNHGSLQAQGTLFSEVRAFAQGHYAGLNTIVQGANVTSQGLKQRPYHPTIFEYLRRHGGYAATDVWFVGNGVDASVPLLNYSANPNYGIKYGANFFAPLVTFYQGFSSLGHGKVYHPENELAPMYRLKAFLDNSFLHYGNGLDALGNTPEEKQQIKTFMNLMYDKLANGTLNTPLVSDNVDAYTIGFATELLTYFRPAFMCVNLNDVDVCHNDFTGYVKALHRADHAVGHLWSVIQNDPILANNTTIICIPETGRNDNPNAIKDSNQWSAYDHSDGQNALRIWSLMAGPGVPQNLTIGSPNSPIGQVTDAMLTVADLLGVKNEVISAGFLEGGTQSFFDAI